MKLYELTNDYLTLMDRIDATDDPEELTTLKDTLESVAGDFDEKVENCCKMYANLKADADLIAEELKRLRDKKTAAENKAERLKEYIRYEMERAGRKKADVGVFRCSFRNNTVVEVDDPETLPGEFQRVTVAADKTALKKALQDGTEVPGARLAVNTSFSIR